MTRAPAHVSATKHVVILLRPEASSRTRMRAEIRTPFDSHQTPARSLRTFALRLSLLAAVPGLCLGQSVLSKATRTSESMEPALVHAQQASAAQQKLDALRAKTGKRPNIVWLVVDDMGYGDPGAFGGGAAIGAATPNMDRLAREGLKLTSTYSQPTCTPTRSAILTGRLPVRTGLTRPILAGDKITKNPWADEISLPKLLGRSRLQDRAVRQVACRRGGRHAPARRRLRRVLRLLRGREGNHAGRRQAPLSRPRAQSRAARDAAQDRRQRRPRTTASRAARPKRSRRSTASRRWPRATGC